ncbi:MAG: hypothetical protein JNL45_12490 [Hyphomicrobium sp.]|nr:hypothetical protein [Hyphomicrobium sp.]
MSRWEAFKGILERNEIFFKTIASVSISAAALLVAVLQWNTAREASSLADMQARIAEANALPQFEITQQQKFNDDTKTYDNTAITINNVGGPVYELSSRAYYFYLVRGQKPGNDASREWIDQQVPVLGYYDTQAVSGASKGVLTTHMGYNNNAKTRSNFDELRKLATQQSWSVFTVEHQVYVGISYADLLGRKHQEYFEVADVGPSRRISSSEAQKVLMLWNDGKRYELDKLKADVFLSELIPSGAKGKKGPN